MHFLVNAREDIYLRLPIKLQNIACSFEGFRIQRMRYGREFWRLLQEAEDR